MGSFGNIQREIRTGLLGALAGAILALALPLAPATATGDPQTPTPERAVSMSPEESGLADLESGPARRTPSQDDPPLTRAAAHERVEAMSPLLWLARYGPVSIGRRD